MKIAFIGFGEAARAFAETLCESDGLTFAAYDILTARGADGDVRAAGEALGVKIAESAPEAVEGAAWVFSAVTASDSLDAGRSVAFVLSPEQIFIDINSVAAGRKRETAAIVEAGGASYVDMAVMAPVHPRGHRTPVLVAGPACAALSPKLADLGFAFSIVSEEIGAATSIKMIRSLFVKGMEALTVQTLLAAAKAGCFERVYGSLAASFPQLGWPDQALYQLERMTRHGIRRAAEMRESAAAYGGLGFAAGHDLAAATADLQQAMGDLAFQVDPREDVEAAFRRLLETLDAEG